MELCTIRYRDQVKVRLEIDCLPKVIFLKNSVESKLLPSFLRNLLSLLLKNEMNEMVLGFRSVLRLCR